MASNLAKGVFYKATESRNQQLLLDLLALVEEWFDCRFDRVMVGIKRGPKKMDDITSFLGGKFSPLTDSVMIGNKESLSASSKQSVVVQYEPSFFDLCHSRFTVYCSEARVGHHNVELVSKLGDCCKCDWGEFCSDAQSRALRAIQDRWYGVPDAVVLNSALEELRFRAMPQIFSFGDRLSWEFYASDRSYGLLAEECEAQGIDSSEFVKQKTECGWYMALSNEPLDLSREDHAAAIVKLHRVLIKLRQA